jgi:hypothetical protein
MRRSDHPSGFSSFDPTTFSFAKLLVIIITIAYHRKCDKMVIIVKDTTNSNSHVPIGLLPSCPHHLYYNNNNSSHFEAPFHNVWTNCTQV